MQKDVDAKLDKILTDDQKKQLKDIRENVRAASAAADRAATARDHPRAAARVATQAPAPPAKNPQ